MTETLHRLIGEKGFERFRRGLESRFNAHRLSYTIQYGETPPNSSLFVRLESDTRIGEICAWESGNCDISLADQQTDDGIKDKHYELRDSNDFHQRLAEMIRCVAPNIEDNAEPDFERDSKPCGFRAR